MKKIFLILNFLMCISGYGQVIESFTDNDFNTDPTWYGNLSAFNFESGKLRSIKPEINSKFFICTPSALVKNTEWSFNVDLLFNPSSANYVDVFLTSSDSNLLTTSNGYFVRLGGLKDEICLYKKVNGVNSLIIDGEDGLLNKSSNNIKLKITCDKLCNWSIAYDATGISGVSEAFADSSLANSGWFGFTVVQSTASFVQKHYFDDVLVSPIVKDTIPPQLVYQNFVENKSFTLKFDEPIDSIWVLNLNNVKLFDRWGKSLPIDTVSFTDKQGLMVNVKLKDSIQIQGTYYLSISNVKDRAGNIISKPISQYIIYFVPAEAKFKDIVFTEFLIDPVPSAGLPEKEFIEIYNNSNKTFDLAGFTLSDPSTSSKLPSHLLMPNSYLIICKDSDVPDFTSFGNTLGLKVMPSLNNSDDDIKLLNPKFELIEEVKYKQTWYNNSLKDDGGYSLEIIDPQNICLVKNNWTVSTSSVGGTPGVVNSVYKVVKDSIPPSILDIIVIKDNQIKLVFNEPVDSTVFISSNFLINPSLTIKSLVWQRDSLDQIKIQFESSLTKNTKYRIQILNLKDCPGNKTNVIGSFILADEAQSGDILINELLFNPYPFGADFIEIYNNSNKVIDLKGWKCANLKNDTVANKSVIFSSTFLLKPYEYLALT
ncbi:MAG: lamin tail domain-containing protein, partial [Opitutaceae bacterium]|nr:lamin tail domain-containing protein [Cytophagales bacterium]